MRRLGENIVVVRANVTQHTTTSIRHCGQELYIPRNTRKEFWQKICILGLTHLTQAEAK